MSKLKIIIKNIFGILFILLAVALIVYVGGYLALNKGGSMILNNLEQRTMVGSVLEGVIIVVIGVPLTIVIAFIPLAIGIYLDMNIIRYLFQKK